MIRGDRVRVDNRDWYAPDILLQDGRTLVIAVLVVSVVLLVALVVFAIRQRRADRSRRG